MRFVLTALVVAAAAALALAIQAGHPAESAAGPKAPAGVTTHALEVSAPEAVTAPSGPPTAPAVEDTSTISASVGAQGSGGFRVSLAGLPAGVTADRFVALAARSGRRWGLTYLGTTSAAPVSGDGKNVVGFGSTAITGAGAETTSLPRRATRTRRCAPVRVVKRVRVGHADAARVVRRVLTVRRCRMVVSSRAGMEQDIVIGRTMPWQAGPAYPTTLQVDLETVLLHEFGHVAGHGHVTGCASTPMWASLSMGDWWRGSGDMRHAGC
jgi:hypothetical protein